MNTAYVLGDIDKLNELSGIQYVLNGKKKKQMIFFYTAFNIPIKLYKTENPLG